MYPSSTFEKPNSKPSSPPRRVVLLYSGGLDTSCLLKWLPEHYGGCEVVTLTVDLGQGEDLEAARAKALALGARQAHVLDASERFAQGFLLPAIQANGLYQGQYPLATALARPLIAELAVELAGKVSAEAIAHGCTGKGNDQVRFEVSIQALNPDLTVLAPVREWDLTRDVEVAYAKDHGVPLPDELNTAYSVDANLWGRSVECGVLEDPNCPPPADIFTLVTPPQAAPDEPENVEIGFQDGVPVALDGHTLEPVALIRQLNARAGAHGVGMVDMVEDRVVGLKSREIYEAPAAVTLIAAHRELEKFCSTAHQNAFKPAVDQRWAELVYQGLWHDPLRENLQAYLESANAGVSGTVTLQLYKGHAQVIGRASECGLYDPKLISYAQGHTFHQEDAVGFIRLWGLPTRSARRAAAKVRP